MSPFKSSTGLDDNIAGLLCYLFTFIGGILFLAVEKRSRFVLFHALQSIFVFGSIAIAQILCGFVPLFGAMLSTLLSLLSIVLWALLMIQAVQGKWFKLPIIGDFAEHQMRSMK
ncbi:DUF4870 domain-containing protein [Paenibacillus sediminis]|uniref:Membrane protein n=1 Tax=Paenibacillus sediminis TaxID=664909 RepID=A0ABS4H7Q5_9BACL|nr:putative membrane protein [Paenibacillus sediminis]